jgi:hypothetical protein
LARCTDGGRICLVVVGLKLHIVPTPGRTAAVTLSIPPLGSPTRQAA